MDARRTGHQHAIGLTRREWLQVGYSGLLGMGLPALLASQADAARPNPAGPKPTIRPRAKSVLLIFLTGAPSHIDTFDMKPEAPEQVRGSFRPIETNAAGVRVCEHLPGLAARADRWAAVRSMTHPVPVHEIGTHFVLSGIDRLPPGATHMASRFDWPCYASGLDALRPRADGVPNGVMLPTYLNNGYGFSGQNAGQLGAKFDPWHIKQDPNEPAFRFDALSLPPGLSVETLAHRRALLNEFDANHAAIERAGVSGQVFGQMQDKAFTMLTSGRVKRAFDLDREDPRLRDRYGRHMFGQSLLLSRRLIEAGVPIVQANMGHMNNWDTHTLNCDQLKDRLLPPLDRGVSTLLDDMGSRGLLDETLVVMLGEFGRTPKLGTDNGGNITASNGRDHWAGAFFAWFAGAGVRGGQAIGRTDKVGAYPATRGYTPADLGATIYASLGLDPGSEVRDPLDRPIRLNQGEIMTALWS